MDSNLAVNALPISISVPEPVPRSELVQIIESALLLNNYALIPGPEPKTVKVINMNAGKKSAKRGSTSLQKSGLAFPKVRLVIDLVLENVSGKYFDGLLRLRPSLGKEISQVRQAGVSRFIAGGQTSSFGKIG